jgi:hypothetical protein
MFAAVGMLLNFILPPKGHALSVFKGDAHEKY